MILVNVLIILLLTLIILQLPKLFNRLMIYLRLRPRDVEGLENMPVKKALTYTDTGLEENPLYLATTNAANINYLKEQVDTLMDLKGQVKLLNDRVDANSEGIAAIGEQMALTAQELTGRDPNSKEPLPMATGLE